MFSVILIPGDPNAYEITMNDDDRIALMVMVKEGKITTEHALEVVSTSFIYKQELAWTFYDITCFLTK